jgi:Periplasmic copper-binding protein (NosD)
MRTRPELTLSLTLVALGAACADPPRHPVAPSFSLVTAATCPTPANVVVTNEAGLNAALAAASPGEVIGLGAFFGVTADVVVNTPNVTLTCATGGAGLFAANPNVVDLIDIIAPGVRLDRLVLDASAAQDGPMTATNDNGITGTAVGVQYTNSTVTCGPGTCAFFIGAARSIVRDDNFTSPGSFTGLQFQASTDPTNTFVISPIDSIQVEGNTIVATAPSVGRVQGGIRVVRGTGVLISGNVVTGPWVNSAGLTTLTAAVVQGNRFDGALVRGIRLSGGNTLLFGPLVKMSAFDHNVITGAGVAGIFAFRACNNTFLGNDLQGNTGNIGIIFPTLSGANTVVGNPGIVVDNGAFDCDGDGANDPNIIVGAGAVLHGVNLGQEVSGAVRQVHGITIQ